jgi:hypothetical protein
MLVSSSFVMLPPRVASILYATKQVTNCDVYVTVDKNLPPLLTRS